MSGSKDRSPLVTGVAFALLAAVCFGLTIPFVKRAGQGLGPFTTAMLLYAGAALSSAFRSRTAPNEAPLRWAHGPRLVALALLGAVVAPVCLTWGLQRTSATSASLVLNTEAIFTVLLARAIYKEPVGHKVAAAAVLMFVAGFIVVKSGDTIAAAPRLGAFAVLVASIAWALDNTLTRPLASMDPRQLTFAKACIGAASSLCLARASGEGMPRWSQVIGLVASGAIGYGVSLRLYLLAQRIIGAGRTGSVFALAPFLGALAGWAMGEHIATASSLLAGALFAVAVYLHLTERHSHAHRHEPIEHEHVHRHDDMHHDHHDDASTEVEHSHWHRHDAVTHDHPHALDVHHQHQH